MNKQIIPNLYLGDGLSCPKQAERILRAAEKYYLIAINNNIDQIEQNKNGIYSNDKRELCLNLEDAFEIDKIKQEAIVEGLKFLGKNHHDLKKKVYVHCEMGLSRSPSLVFIYLTQKKILSVDQFEIAFSEFMERYQEFTPNHGMWNFIKTHFPYHNLLPE